MRRGLRTLGGPSCFVVRRLAVPRGALQIAGLLPRTTSLVSLNLADNKIKEAGCVAIGRQVTVETLRTEP